MPATATTDRCECCRAAFTARVARFEPVDCVCEAGQVLAMKPLLVHSSGAATRPRRRRVVHLEFCPSRLLPPEFKRIDLA